jgi:hypothetical protein
VADIGESTVQEVVFVVDHSPLSTELLMLKAEPASAQSPHEAEVVELFIPPYCVKVIVAG